MSKNVKIKKQEVKLFLNSETCNDYPVIKKILNSIDKKYPYLSNEDFNILSESEKELINTLFGSIYSRCTEEWITISEGTIAEMDNPICELCGKKNIKFISKIKNNKNNKTLIIGSECINHWKKTNDDLEAIKENKLLSITREAKGLINNLDKFKNIFEIEIDRKRIISKNLTQKYIKLKEECKKFYASVEKSKNNSLIKKGVNLNKELILFFDDLEKYIYFSENNDYGLDLQICRHYLEYEYKKNQSSINELEVKGKIDFDVIDFIKEPDFLRQEIFKFKSLINEKYKFVDKENKGSTFTVIYNDESYTNVYLIIDGYKFIKRNKRYLFYNESVNVSLVNILNILNIHSRSLYYVANRFIDKLKCSYKLLDLNETYDTIAFTRDKKVYVVKLSLFIQTYKILLIQDDVDQNINTFIKSTNEIFDSIEEYRNIY